MCESVCHAAGHLEDEVLGHFLALGVRAGHGLDAHHLLHQFLELRHLGLHLLFRHLLLFHLIGFLLIFVSYLWLLGFRILFPMSFLSLLAALLLHVGPLRRLQHLQQRENLTLLTRILQQSALTPFRQHLRHGLQVLVQHRHEVLTLGQLLLVVPLALPLPTGHADNRRLGTQLGHDRVHPCPYALDHFILPEQEHHHVSPALIIDLKCLEVAAQLDGHFAGVVLGGDVQVVGRLGAVAGEVVLEDGDQGAGQVLIVAEYLQGHLCVCDMIWIIMGVSQYHGKQYCRPCGTISMYSRSLLHKLCLILPIRRGKTKFLHSRKQPLHCQALYIDPHRLHTQCAWDQPTRGSANRYYIFKHIAKLACTYLYVPSSMDCYRFLQQSSTHSISSYLWLKWNSVIRLMQNFRVSSGPMRDSTSYSNSPQLQVISNQASITSSTMWVLCRIWAKLRYPGPQVSASVVNLLLNSCSKGATLSCQTYRLCNSQMSFQKTPGKVQKTLLDSASCKISTLSFLVYLRAYLVSCRPKKRSWILNLTSFQQQLFSHMSGRSNLSQWSHLGNNIEMSLLVYSHRTGSRGLLPIRPSLWIRQKVRYTQSNLSMHLKMFSEISSMPLLQARSRYLLYTCLEFLIRYSDSCRHSSSSSDPYCCRDPLAYSRKLQRDSQRKMGSLTYSTSRRRLDRKMICLLGLEYRQCRWFFITRKNQYHSSKSGKMNSRLWPGLDLPGMGKMDCRTCFLSSGRLFSGFYRVEQPISEDRNRPMVLFRDRKVSSSMILREAVSWNTSCTILSIHLTCLTKPTGGSMLSPSMTLSMTASLNTPKTDPLRMKLGAPSSASVSMAKMCTKCRVHSEQGIHKEWAYRMQECSQDRFFWATCQRMLCRSSFSSQSSLACSDMLEPDWLSVRVQYYRQHWLQYEKYKEVRACSPASIFQRTS